MPLAEVFYLVSERIISLTMESTAGENHTGIIIINAIHAALDDEMAEPEF